MVEDAVGERLAVAESERAKVIEAALDARLAPKALEVATKKVPYITGLDKMIKELKKKNSELDKKSKELEKRSKELEKRSAELEQRLSAASE